MFASLGYLRPEMDFLLRRKLGWLPPIQGLVLQDSASLRHQPELLFTWWGVSGHPSNLNPFLRIALDDFLASVADFAKEKGIRHALVFKVPNSRYCIVPRLVLLLASCDSPAQRQVSGERGPGASLGGEKCHQFGRGMSVISKCVLLESFCSQCLKAPPAIASGPAAAAKDRRTQPAAGCRATPTS